MISKESQIFLITTTATKLYLKQVKEKVNLHEEDISHLKNAVSKISNNFENISSQLNKARKSALCNSFTLHGLANNFHFTFFSDSIIDTFETDNSSFKVLKLEEYNIHITGIYKPPDGNSEMFLTK
jgi:hypothetical protein